MTDPQVRGATDAWFARHGLPWFVETEHDRVAALLRADRVVHRLAAFAAAALVPAAGTVWLVGSPSTGAAVWATVTGVLVLVHAATRLQLSVVARWAGARSVDQIGLVVPLVTRALPLLLIFTVFFFINTEVWQVASSLPGGVLWMAVLLFAAVAALFLIARLPEEVDRVLGQVDAADLRRVCRGTPLEDAAVTHAEAAAAAHRSLSPLQRGNLVLVLLVVQASQVLLLALAVFGFFLLFGAVAIRPEIVESWVGRPPSPLGWGDSPVTVELVKVAVFLAAFSGLYFTVYAVTDPTYRAQFFTQITTELERAVGVRAVYAELEVVPPAGERAPPA